VKSKYDLNVVKVAMAGQWRCQDQWLRARCVGVLLVRAVLEYIKFPWWLRLGFGVWSSVHLTIAKFVQTRRRRPIFPQFGEKWVPNFVPCTNA